MSLSKINYAKLDNQIAFIDDVNNGLDCNCICLSCGKKLVAKNKGKIKEHHFSHYKSNECKYAYETMLHELAKKIIVEDMGIGELPEKKVYFDKVLRDLNVASIFKEFVVAKTECKLGDIIPDVLLIDKNNKPLIIEIYVTHKIDFEKREKIIKQKLSCIEINLSSFNRIITEKELRDYLRQADHNWVNFYLSDAEEEIFINDFTRTDEYEIIPSKAIKYYPKEFCGLKHGQCNGCRYSYYRNNTNTVLCRFKVGSLKENLWLSNLNTSRNSEYFITEINYVKNSQKCKNKYKTIGEIEKELFASSVQIIKIGEIKYEKSNISGSIVSIWNKKKRSRVIVLKNNMEIYEICKGAYKTRVKNKYIEGLKLGINSNSYEKITDYNKKIWCELVKVKESKLIK